MDKLVWLGLSLVFISATAFSQEQIITYEPINAVASADGKYVSGDILVTRNSNVNEIVPFEASTASFSSPGSVYLPPVDSFSFEAKPRNNGGGGGGGGNPPTHPKAWQVFVFPAVCVAMTGLTRGWCTSDCGARGVSSWDSGGCGAKATCHCNKPPVSSTPQPVPAPVPRQPGQSFNTNHFPYTAFAYTEFWTLHEY